MFTIEFKLPSTSGDIAVLLCTDRTCLTCMPWVSQFQPQQHCNSIYYTTSGVLPMRMLMYEK